MSYRLSEEYKTAEQKTRNIAYELAGKGYGCSVDQVIEDMDIFVHAAILIAVIEDGKLTDREENAIKYLTRRGNIMSELKRLYDQSYDWWAIDYYDQSAKNLMVARAKAIAIPHGDKFFSVLKTYDVVFGTDKVLEIGSHLLQMVVLAANVEGLAGRDKYLFERSAQKGHSLISEVGDKYLF
jgi:hypothetical protein